MTVIKSSEGYIFGGYIENSWNSSSSCISSKQAFMFSLHCHAGLPPTPFELVKGHEDNAAMGMDLWMALVNKYCVSIVNGFGHQSLCQ